jgi:DNA-binding Lrp family transcriptional regulator
MDVSVEILRSVEPSRKFRHIDEQSVGVTMTAKDEELLGLLKVNAREPVASLARKLGVSRTTVQDRIKKLEETGVIGGYAVRLGKGARVPGISALVTIYAEPRQAADVTKAVTLLSQVETLHTVSGKFDLVAIVKAPSSEEMDKVLDRISDIKGVTDIETAVILSTKLDRR